MENRHQHCLVPELALLALSRRVSKRDTGLSLLLTLFSWTCFKCQRTQLGRAVLTQFAMVSCEGSVDLLVCGYVDVQTHICPCIATMKCSCCRRLATNLQTRRALNVRPERWRLSGRKGSGPKRRSSA